MKEFLDHLKISFYSGLLLSITLIIALFISIRNRKKFNVLKFFPIYITGLFFASLTIFKKRVPIISSLSGLLHYIDYFFTLLELLIFSNFYTQIIKSPIIRKSILTINILFLPFFVYMALTDKDFYWSVSENTQTIVYSVEGVILLYFSCAYFFDLFNKVPVLILKEDPAFWISTGLLFFSACTLPYSLLENYILKYHHIYANMSYSIFYIFYILLFLMIIRAYLCKPDKTI